MPETKIDISKDPFGYLWSLVKGEIGEIKTTSYNFRIIKTHSPIEPNVDIINLEIYDKGRNKPREIHQSCRDNTRSRRFYSQFGQGLYKVNFYPPYELSPTGVQLPQPEPAESDSESETFEFDCLVKVAQFVEKQLNS